MKLCIFQGEGGEEGDDISSYTQVNTSTSDASWLLFLFRMQGCHRTIENRLLDLRLHPDKCPLDLLVPSPIRNTPALLSSPLRFRDPAVCMHVYQAYNAHTLPRDPITFYIDLFKALPFCSIWLARPLSQVRLGRM